MAPEWVCISIPLNFIFISLIMKKILPFVKVGPLTLALAALPVLAFAAGEHGAEAAMVFLMIAVVLIAAKIAGMVEKFGQPSVLGELVMGVILGNLALVGITLFEPIKENGIILFLAELGVVILLFQVGLESNIAQMRKVGLRAFGVAILGVVVPFVLGTYVAGPLLLSNYPFVTHLFLGAALTATSVGITARVFKDFGKIKLPAAQTVLGAAVIDDVLGLVILAVVAAIATVGAVSVGMVSWIIGKAVLFLVGAIVIGHFAAPHLGRLFAMIHTGATMKFTLALSIALVFAYAAQQIGLAPIIGAFAAGLVLDAVHFKFFRDPEVVADVRAAIADSKDPAVKQKVDSALASHSHRHVEDLMEPLAHFLVPIFFIVTGMSVNLAALFDTQILLTALVITVIALFGKIIAGIAAEKGTRWLVGWGMVPRGEVGLIFASIGLGLGVLSEAVFSVIVIMVIVTTLLTPPILAKLLKKHQVASTEN